MEDITLTDVDAMLTHPFWVSVNGRVYECFTTLDEALAMIEDDKQLMSEPPALEPCVYAVMRVTFEMVA